MKTRTLTICLAAAASLGIPAAPALAQTEAACVTVPEPVVSLSYGSRYIDDDDSRSVVDEESEQAVNDALRPIDDFLRDLTSEANAVLRGGDDRQEKADCVVAAIAEWAEADALSDLGTFNAGLTVGARYAGFAMAYRQVRPYSSLMAEGEAIEEWLSTRVREQMTFWEEEATPGAKTGNLRAWAALAVNLVGDVTGDDDALFWSASSITHVMCTALDDGSLPQEMKRGNYALHYQLHAISPLVVTAALLEEQGLSVKDNCGDALQRIVIYALNDIENEGAAAMEYSGKEQSYWDGTEELESHEMAWLEAYLTLFPDPEIDAYAEQFRPLGNSKLGGSQSLLWGAPTN